MICDMLAMYYAYCVAQSLAFSSRHSIAIFVRSRPLLVLHHLVMVLGYPLLVVRDLFLSNGS